MSSTTKVIDLFAGPGGLGEGFASMRSSGGKPFDIAISIEKEASAHRTLTLRSFFRQFDEVPDEYYQFLKGELGKQPEDQLYKNPKFKKQVKEAKKEARLLTLGEDNSEVQNAIDNKIGNSECILIGGPPCQAYSLVGRARNKGNREYNALTDHRNFLYKEYLNIIARYQPKIFVMENVKGLLSAKINGKPLFEDLIQDLQDPCAAVSKRPKKGRIKRNYRIVSLVTEPKGSDLFEDSSDDVLPKHYVIKGELYGIPQKRHRVILLGIREDIADKWDYSLILKQKENQIPLQEVLGDLPQLRSGLSKEDNSEENWLAVVKKSSKKLSKIPLGKKYDEVTSGMKALSQSIMPIKNSQGKNLGLRSRKKMRVKSNPDLQEWYSDQRLDGYVTNHECRGHIASDIERYMFCAVWAKAAKNNPLMPPFPKSLDYPAELKPNHKNFDSGKFADRFRVQVDYNPGTTVTSHISKDGHYFIHFDPKQCRSLTVREAARIQTFPDNYFFCGNRTQQYVQVGNAVPPYLAREIARIVRDLLNS